MKFLMITAAALSLAACTSPEKAFTGSPHGYSGRADTWWGIDAAATPTILQPGEAPLHSEYGSDGSAADMPSTYNVDTAGNVSATGVAAYMLAKGSLCARAPNAVECGGAPPVE